MYNEYVTQEFTIRDLLTHRSGLGLGAGDLMIGLTEVILLPLILYKTYSI
jgi:CubicO group peptidase (beta-lactamase class C family)